MSNGQVERHGFLSLFVELDVFSFYALFLTWINPRQLTTRLEATMVKVLCERLVVAMVVTR